MKANIIEFTLPQKNHLKLLLYVLFARWLLSVQLVTSYERWLWFYQIIFIYSFLHFLGLSFIHSFTGHSFPFPLSSLFPFLPFFLSSFVPSFIQVISVAMPNYALKHKCQIGGMASFPCSFTRRLCHADELQCYKGETLSGP